MDTYQGSIANIVNHNEKTGYATFFINRNNGQKLKCNGIIPSYPNLLPIKVEGDWVEDSFSVKNISIIDTDKSAIKEFLCSRYFQQIGESQAEKLLALGNGDFLNFIIQNTNNTSLSNIQLACINKFYLLLCFEKLYNMLLLYGGDYYGSKKFFKEYSVNCFKQIEKNPYSMLNAGISIEVCEKLAKKKGMKESDKKRLYSIIDYILENNNRNGNTYIDFVDLCKKFKKIEQKTNLYNTHRIFIGETVSSKKYVLENKENNIRVYKKEDFDAELLISQNINRINQTSRCLNNLYSVEEIEKEYNLQYSQEQKQLFKLLEKSGIKIITGGPGTGKTTVLNGIIKKIQKEYPQEQVCLCAPTGCAARRMQEVTGMPAQTINKLLKIMPYENINNIPKTEILSNFIIVDEVSMVDTYLAARLLSSVKNGSLVILIGDPNQLPSVGAGNILDDLLNSCSIETYRLTQIFRQTESGAIIDNSYKVIQGINNLKEDKSFTIKRFNTEEELVDYARNVSKHLYKTRKSFNVYTPSRKRKFKSGTINLNKYLSESYREAKGYVDDNCVYFGDYCFHEKDRIVFTENSYEKDYFNGQTGHINSIQKVNGVVKISILSNDELIELSSSELENIELGYAITAHKSQGGECENAIIIIPQEPKSLLKRQLLYVEITRAKKNVFILAEKDSLEDTISDKYEYSRLTGLRDKLIVS